jgi:hypothetical protein
MRLIRQQVPLNIRFAKYSESRLAIRQQYSPKFDWLAPEPKRSTSKPQPKPAPRGPSRRGKR